MGDSSQSAEHDHSTKEAECNGDGKAQQVSENVKYPGGLGVEKVGILPSKQGCSSGDDEEDD